MKKTFKHWALVCLFFFYCTSLSFAQQAKYVFYFIGDGMGVNQVNGTEMYLAELNGRIGISPLCFPGFPVVGLATSFSGTNSVTDSAAAGTALATGKKTKNGAIGVTQDDQPVYSVADWAKKAGRNVGVTTSVSVDHATPAAFYAHQPSRLMYYEIALDLPVANFDFYGGAGFLRPTGSGEEKDKRPVFEIFDEAGYTVARGYEDFKNKCSGADKMIMIDEEGKSIYGLPYAIDRKEGDLTLAQVTESAVSFLTKEDNGFFLMVEGGKIDWACHDNDAATTFMEVIDMDEAVRVAYDFYLQHPDETLIVVTADHETGGLGLGRGPYELNLKVLANQKGSQGTLHSEIRKLREAKEDKVAWEDIQALLKDFMGFWDTLTLTEEQEQRLKKVYDDTFFGQAVEMTRTEYARTEPLAVTAKQIINEMAYLGWVSGGHSASYVPVFAIGAGSELFKGRYDNIDIPKKIAEAGGY